MLKITISQGPCVENYKPGMIEKGILTIVNDGTGDAEVGNYTFTLTQKGNEVVTGVITNHNRNKSVWDLVGKCLIETSGESSKLQLEELLEISVELVQWGFKDLTKKIGEMFLANAGPHAFYDYTWVSPDGSKNRLEGQIENIEEVPNAYALAARVIVK
jgi:hypothetical protein